MIRRRCFITVLFIMLEVNWCQQKHWHVDRNSSGNVERQHSGIVNGNNSETQSLSGLNNGYRQGHHNGYGKVYHNGNENRSGRSGIGSENGYTIGSENKPESILTDIPENRSGMQSGVVPGVQSGNGQGNASGMQPGSTPEIGSENAYEREQSTKTSNHRTNTSTPMKSSPLPQMASGKKSYGSSKKNVTRTSDTPTDKMSSVGKEIMMPKTIDTVENPRATGNRSKNAMPNENNLDPPLELFPPKTLDAPELLAADADELKFVVKISCNKPECPAAFVWSYKKDGTQWKHILNTNIREYTGGINSIASFTNLEKNTKYYVRVQPYKLDFNNTPSVNWYHHSPYSPYSPSSTGFTCDEKQEGVRDLLVHSAGPRWLALSWEPPIPECNTYLKYHIIYYGELLPGNTWKTVSAFWSNGSMSLEGNVKPCALWPGRHCLLIMNGIDPVKNYIIQLKVLRVADNITSETNIVSEQSALFAPSSPLDLHCVEAQPTSLKLRWRCPLKIGGRLTLVHIRVQETVENGNYNVTDVSKEVGMRLEYQHTIVGLNPSTLYKVTVWFESFGGFNGNPASLEVWTIPDSPLVKASAVPCSVRVAENPTAVSAAASRTTEDLADGGSLWWAWTLVALSLIAVAVLAFFVGRSSLDIAAWKIVKMIKSSSVHGSEEGTRVAQKDIEHCETLTARNTVSSEQGHPSFKDYAELLVHPAGSRPLPSISNDYEDPHDICVEQPYAEALSTTPPPPYYSEVPPPPTSTPSSLPSQMPSPMPVYAQVDKKRRNAPSPPLAVNQQDSPISPTS